MVQYANRSRRSAVSSFKIGEDHIHIRFKGGIIYVYDHTRPGAAHVQAMKALAYAGKGLSTYVNQKLSANDYARKYLEHEPMVRL